MPFPMVTVHPQGPHTFHVECISETLTKLANTMALDSPTSCWIAQCRRLRIIAFSEPTYTDYTYTRYTCCFPKSIKNPHITGSLLSINHSVCTNIIQLPQVSTHKKNEANSGDWQRQAKNRKRACPRLFSLTSSAHPIMSEISRMAR